MRVVVTTESRFSRTPDGRVWVPHVPDYRIWQRYLTAFDEVRVVARVRDRSTTVEGMLPVDGDGVTVHPVPYYVGPRQYLQRLSAVRRAIAEAARPEDAVILRVPSTLGSMLAGQRRRQGARYAVEVVGDPYDVFAPGTSGHPLRPLLRRRFAARLRQECASAAAASYVTEAYLQDRYPPSPDVPTAALSSVDLPPEAFVPRARNAVDRRTGVPVLVTVSVIEQMYKGVDTLVTAVAELRDAGVPVRLVHVGGGRLEPRVRRLAGALGVDDRVVFVGTVPPGARLRAHLDDADLFVMPSRTEGLPRALIEAMARGLPALGTRVGGIPELLAPEDLVPPDDPRGLGRAIAGMLRDADRMAAASARNLARARDFSRQSLTPRREDFYRAVREAAGEAPSVCRLPVATVADHTI
ncbi:glycosyltransferase family 4 protein [Micromonospora mirobrigensis]|uniref:Glycosyltransferase involved in cell wall bisynthesis n=1 Tax=Micromonospora mirobrigensis TaxID=262898 RepID=A0A1C4Z991_9ACTN|nr:glycosyltransferase family 4 protein [Micromonospora mirobrigensis]SCF29500.1 Glycosyltransferase involved in cell wall bisynthesis [Micromonospora mirobrigensis]